MNADDYLDFEDFDEDDDRFIRMSIFNARLDNLGGRCRICCRAIYVIVEVEEVHNETGDVRVSRIGISFISYLAWLKVSQETVYPVGILCRQCDESDGGHMPYLCDDEALLEMIMGNRLSLEDETSLLELRNDEIDGTNN